MDSVPYLFCEAVASLATKDTPFVYGPLLKDPIRNIYISNIQLNMRLDKDSDGALCYRLVDKSLPKEFVTAVPGCSWTAAFKDFQSNGQVFALQFAGDNNDLKYRFRRKVNGRSMNLTEMKQINGKYLQINSIRATRWHSGVFWPVQNLPELIDFTKFHSNNPELTMSIELTRLLIALDQILFSKIYFMQRNDYRFIASQTERNANVKVFFQEEINKCLVLLG